MRAKSLLSKLGILIVVGDRIVVYYDTNLTVEECASFCINFGYSCLGVQYAGECYSGNVLQAGSVPAPQSDCDMARNGNG
jgi:hypothetical protein